MNQYTSERLFKIDCGDIYLQEFSIEDVANIFRISNQPEIVEFLSDWKSTIEQRLEWVTNYEIPTNKEFLQAVDKTSDPKDYILKLGVFIKRSDEFIGWCCTGIKEELSTPNREIMYAISNEYQNKGYATKASKGLIDYLFTKTNLEIINAVALVNNIPSNKVLEKCGFTFQGQQIIQDGLHHHYILSKSVWKRRNLRNNLLD